MGGCFVDMDWTAYIHVYLDVWQACCALFLCAVLRRLFLLSWTTKVLQYLIRAWKIEGARHVCKRVGDSVVWVNRYWRKTLTSLTAQHMILKIGDSAKTPFWKQGNNYIHRKFSFISTRMGFQTWTRSLRIGGFQWVQGICWCMQCILLTM